MCILVSSMEISPVLDMDVLVPVPPVVHAECNQQNAISTTSEGESPAREPSHDMTVLMSITVHSECNPVNGF